MTFSYTMSAGQMLNVERRSPEAISETSSDFFDEEARILACSSPSAAELIGDSLKKWSALVIWMITVVPIVLNMLRIQLPDYFGVNLAVWARFSLSLIFIQAAVRLAIYMVIRWIRRSDAERLSSGSSQTSGLDLASYLEAVVAPMTMLLSTIIFAGLWYSVYPIGCPPSIAEDVAASIAEDADSSSGSIPIVDEETAATSIVLNSLKASAIGGSSFSVWVKQTFTHICIYEFITDLIVCLIIVNSVLILEKVLMRMGLWKFLRSNFQERILENRYRTYVIEAIRKRSELRSELSGAPRALPISFPFVLPFHIPLFDRMLNWLNEGILDVGPTGFDAASGRPLSYLEYKHRLDAWVSRHGLDEAVENVVRMIPQTDAESKQVAKDLFKSLCTGDRDYVLPSDFQQIFHGRAAARDAYALFDRDQDGSVSKTEFRHMCIIIYREMRNLAASVTDAGSAFQELADWIHILVIIALFCICLVVFGVQVQSIFAIILSLVLGLNVVVGDVAKKAFQGIIFLFVDHPYDVGDRILVSSLSEKDPLVIDQINMLTTVFHRWNGQLLYVPNASLASATIYNISRSPEQWERVDFSISIAEGASSDGLGNLRDRLEAFLKAHAADYMAAYELKPMIAGEMGKSEGSLEVVKLTLRVQCRPTLDSQKKWTRHSKLLTFLRSAIQASNLNLAGIHSEA